MKLGDFLSSSAHSRPAATRAVGFKVVGRDARMCGVVADAKAEIVFVPEAARQEALRDADKAVRELYQGEPISGDARDQERVYHVLFRALRDSDDPRQPFAESVAQLKASIALPECLKLWGEYARFVDEEFPDTVDAETFAKMVEEAKKNSLSALLSSFGYEEVRRCMSGLLLALKK